MEMRPSVSHELSPWIIPIAIAAYIVGPVVIGMIAGVVVVLLPWIKSTFRAFGVVSLVVVLPAEIGIAWLNPDLNPWVQIPIFAFTVPFLVTAWLVVARRANSP